MNEKLKYKEILLMRKVFTSRHFCETVDRLSDNRNTKKEKLLAAYNSLLLSLMPEISEQNSIDKKIYVCQMTAQLLLLELRFGEINTEGQLQYSIDPDSIMPSQILSYTQRLK
jgi:hypothetical protein